MSDSHLLVVVAEALTAVAVIAFLGRHAFRRVANRTAVRTARRFGMRIERYKLARRSFVRAELLEDPGIAAAVRDHAAAEHVSEATAWAKVRGYIQEIVPFFNIIAYYHVGYRASEILLRLFYKVSIEYEDRAARDRLPRDAVVVYLMNHRSNADYVLVSYVLAGDVALSYAVGEWARAFPLEHLFKAFGSYFVRRRFREPLYHAVLERYVQLITRQGVTQGIFLEGGLTRDGTMRPAKIGLLDYVLGIARDPAYRPKLFVVPVAVNYDRVLEDRSLLRELASRAGRGRPARLRQAREVVHYVGWNLIRLVGRRWRRYGRAAVVVGAPIPLEPWFEQEHDLFQLARPDRLARVQALSDDVMRRIGALIPVTPVPLACAAIRSLDRDFIPRAMLSKRMAELRDGTVELNGRVIRADRDIEETLDRALLMLRMRRILVPEGDGFVVMPRNRELVSYYANSIAHLVAPFERTVRYRDTSPISRLSIGKDED